MLNRDIDTS